MKKLVVSIVALFLIFGCESKEEAKVESKKESSTAPAKIEVVTDAVDVVEDSPFVRYNIDGDRIVRFAPDGEETAVTKQLGAMATVRNRYDTVGAELLKKKLSKNFILKCSACHDDYANGVIGPSLLTKSSDEIYDSIAAYKTATKVNVLMKDLVSHMDDSEIRALADEIAEFNKEVRSK